MPFQSDNLCFRFVGSLGSIIVKCKDLRVIQLDIPGMEECLNIASSIEVKIIFVTYATVCQMSVLARGGRGISLSFVAPLHN